MKKITEEVLKNLGFKKLQLDKEEAPLDWKGKRYLWERYDRLKEDKFFGVEFGSICSWEVKDDNWEVIMFIKMDEVLRITDEDKLMVVINGFKELYNKINEQQK